MYNEKKGSVHLEKNFDLLSTLKNFNKKQHTTCLSRVFFKIVLNERLIPWTMKFTGSANIVNKYGLLVCMLSLRYFIVVFYTFFLNLCRIGPTKMFHPILEL